MIRSLAQQEQSAYRLLQNAYAGGVTDDDAAIDYATAAMGEASRALIGRVHAREFRVTRP